MTETTKTARGWMIDYTDTVLDCLRVGGVCGRRVLYTREQLERHGIDYNSNPLEQLNEYGLTQAGYLLDTITPARVIRRGEVIR